MKRDMDLVRRVLFELEKCDEDIGWIDDFKIEGVDPKTLILHLRLMDEAGLIQVIDLSDHEGIDYRPRRITWRGHEFLDLIRSQTVWEKTKKIALEKTGGLALSAIEAAARYYAAKLFGPSAHAGHDSGGGELI